MKHGSYEEGAEAQRRAILKACNAHLKDILREHGYDKTWASYIIPPETATPLRRYPPVYLSAMGSPAAMCEAM